MRHLFTFFLHRDISKYQPRMIPMTSTKQEMINASKDSYELFFDEYIDRFDGDGWISKDAYEHYKQFCSENGYSNPLSNKSFGLKIKRFVDIIKRRRGPKIICFYHFNILGKQRFEEIKAEREQLKEDLTLVRTECIF